MAIQRANDRMVRVGYGTRQMAGTPEGSPIELHPRCEKLLAHLRQTAGSNERTALQKYFGQPKFEICVGRGTIDMMVFDTTARTAYVSRGPEYGPAWQAFQFTSAAASLTPTAAAHKSP